MVISNTFEQAWLDFIEMIAGRDARNITLVKFNEEEWGVCADSYLLFEDNENITPACIFKIMKKLFKYPDLGNIKEIDLYYNTYTKEYDYDIAMTF